MKFYIIDTSSLILIYNGVYKNSAILPLLPKFVINHYFFLKLKLPDLVPSINVSYFFFFFLLNTIIIIIITNIVD